MIIKCPPPTPRLNLFQSASARQSGCYVENYTKERGRYIRKYNARQLSVSSFCVAIERRAMTVCVCVCCACGIKFCVIIIWRRRGAYIVYIRVSRRPLLWRHARVCAPAEGKRVTPFSDKLENLVISHPSLTGRREREAQRPFSNCPSEKTPVSNIRRN